LPTASMKRQRSCIDGIMWMCSPEQISSVPEGDPSTPSNARVRVPRRRANPSVPVPAQVGSKTPKTYGSKAVRPGRRPVENGHGFKPYHRRLSAAPLPRQFPALPRQCTAVARHARHLHPAPMTWNFDDIHTSVARGAE
jgi:hypothetical protein